MRSKRSARRPLPQITGALTLVLLLLGTWGGPAAAETCPFDTSWLEGAAPAQPLTVTARNPSAGVDECDFYRFAWQYFLYLVQPDGSTPTFDGWPVVDEVFPYRRAHSPCPGGHQPIIHKFDESNQAGSSALLYDQHGNQVFYQIFMDPELACTIDSCDLSNYGCIRDAMAQPTATSFALPVGSVELKTSWRQLPSSLDSQASHYYTVEADLQPPGSTGQCKEDVRMGMAGMHLTVKTQHHPEFLWFTFEQVDNAPDCVAGSCQCPAGQGRSDGSCKQDLVGCQVPVTQGGPNGFWAFADNTGGAMSAANSNPANICRAFHDGGGSATNSAFIDSINEQAQGALGSSVWSNYVLVGGQWTQDGKLEFDGNILLNQAGSLKLANASMETYTQNDSCFNCHSPRPKKTGKTGQILFSHLFGTSFVPKDTTATCPITIDNSCYSACVGSASAHLGAVPSHSPASATLATAPR